MANRPTLDDVAGGATLNPTVYNKNNNTVEVAFDNLLGRGGVSESNNSLTNDLDFDGNTGRNLKTPTSLGDIATKQYVDAATDAGSPDNAQLKVSLDDTTAGFLETKLVGDSTVNVTVLNAGGDETLQMAVTLASQAEAEAGAENTKTMTPLRTKQAIETLSDAGTTAYDHGGTGSVTRTIESKLQESISVLDFGAVGDGVADDTLAIQAAIDVAENTGQSLYVPKGTYLVSSTLLISKCFMYGDVVVKDNFSIDVGFVVAVGSILKATTSAEIMTIGTFVGATEKSTGSGLRSIAFDGDGNSTNCLSLENTDRNNVELCSFEGSTSSQVKVMAINRAMPNSSATDSQNNVFVGNIIVAQGSAVGLQLGSDSFLAGNASFNSFTNTYVRHADGTGIYLQNADSNIFMGTRATRLLAETGDAIVFGEGGPGDNQHARTNQFFNMHSSQGRIKAEGTTSTFPSADNVIYGWNLDGASGSQDIIRDSFATLSVMSARQHDIPAQNLVAVANTTPSNFHNTPFTAGTARAKFADVGFYPANVFGDSGRILQFFDSSNDALYKLTVGSTGATWVVPTNITDPAMDFTGWKVQAKTFLAQGNQVVSGRKTGWGVPTGTTNRTTFDSNSVTLAGLAARVKGLIDDLKNHGLIGS